LLATALLFNLASAPVRADDSTQAADRHFKSGLAAAKAGKMTLAASEFEQAYDSAPHYSVLYNLGLVYAALGRNADAVRVLRRYLVDGGEKVSANRRREVEGIVSERSVGLSHVSPRILPADATVTLDARTLAPAELGAPIAIDPGHHLLAVRREGYEASVHPFEVTTGETTNLEVELTAVAVREPAPRMVAILADCPIPDVELWIDGERADSGGSEVPRVVTEGQHSLRFTRPGYSVDERRVEFREGQRIQCRLRSLAPLPPELAATLQISLPPGATAFVDGVRFVAGRVPAGRHRVVVLNQDYSTWQRDVDVPKGRTVRLEPSLTPLSERRRREEEVGVERRTWAMVSVGAGLSLIATGVVLYVVNGPRYEEWQEDNAAFAKKQDATSSQLKGEAAELRQRAIDIQRLDDIALGAGALGVVSLGIGVGLFLTSASSSKGEGTSWRVALDGPRGFSFQKAW
jgi:hypothetical protein